MSRRTYGQVNYEAFTSVIAPVPKWDELSQETRDAWERAAWTVIAARQVHEDTPGSSRRSHITIPEVNTWLVLASEGNTSDTCAEGDITDSQGRKATT